MATKSIGLDSLSPIETRQENYSKLDPPSANRLGATTIAARSVQRSQWYALVITRSIASMLVIALITEFFLHGPSVNVTTVGFTYLLAILAASTLLDLRLMVVMSVTAALAYDYFFLPPVGTFNINDSQDWVALFAFLTTALVGSELAAKSRKRTEEATRRRVEVERLYTLSRKLLSTGTPVDLFNAIPSHIATSFALESAALYLYDKPEVFCAGVQLPASEAQNLRSAATLPHPQVATDRNVSFAPIRLGDSVSGSLALGGPPLSEETLEAIAALVAVAIDKARAIEQVAKIEASRENERLKSVLLDAITHDFRTPLTSIKVSATGLLEDLDFDRSQRKELLVIINEECDRISELVGEASEMSRLESGEVKLNIASHSICELISSALAACKILPCDREVSLDVKHPDVPITVDLPLAKKVLVHLINNAHLYSSPGKPIAVRTEERDGFEFISVSDQGPGIDEAEVNQIFDKFYRGKNQRYRVPGTGMGLPIAKAIVAAHGGTIGVVSRIGHGSVFTFSLPIEKMDV